MLSRDLYPVAPARSEEQGIWLSIWYELFIPTVFAEMMEMEVWIWSLEGCWGGPYTLCDQR